jgi:putative addiction module component (TIGR02574 family)
MDRDFETIAREAEQLDPSDRARLAERLVESVIESSPHRAAWLAESKRRAEAYDRGEIEGFDAAEVFKDVRKMIGK